MSRRRRFTGHRDHLGRYILGMQDTPPPTIPKDEDDAGGVIPHQGLRQVPVGSGVLNYRKSPHSSAVTQEE
jgi:hypothetical protein